MKDSRSDWLAVRQIKLQRPSSEWAGRHAALQCLHEERNQRSLKLRKHDQRDKWCSISPEEVYRLTGMYRKCRGYNWWYIMRLSVPLLQSDVSTSWWGLKCCHRSFVDGWRRYSQHRQMDCSYIDILLRINCYNSGRLNAIIRSDLNLPHTLVYDLVSSTSTRGGAALTFFSLTNDSVSCQWYLREASPDNSPVCLRGRL